ncbi:MAG: Lrp/AsnC family transcriptional regulator [Actinobacteria bacterium]|nr:Lrp/AsnC family transcriptional regulator [Actinomycetota bacterium]
MNEFRLTDVDRALLRELARDGRLPYKELAARVGLPVSTCHGRVRALEAAGVIRGYRAEIDPAAANLSVEALISVTISGQHRSEVPHIAERLRDIPGVQRVFLIAGDRDLMLQVACPSVAALRELISMHLGANKALEHTRTSLIFEQLSGTAPA